MVVVLNPTWSWSPNLLWPWPSKPPSSLLPNPHQHNMPNPHRLHCLVGHEGRPMSIHPHLNLDLGLCPRKTHSITLQTSVSAKIYKVFNSLSCESVAMYETVDWPIMFARRCQTNLCQWTLGYRCQRGPTFSNKIPKFIQFQVGFRDVWHICMGTPPFKSVILPNSTCKISIAIIYQFFKNPQQTRIHIHVVM